MKRFFFWIAPFVLSVISLTAGEYSQDIEYCRAQITDIARTQKTDGAAQYQETVFTLKILSGNRTGETRTVTFKGADDMPSYVKYHNGDTIFIGLNRIIQQGQKDEYIALYDKDNSAGLIVIVILFLGVLFAVGRLRGLRSLAGLAFTVVMIFAVYIPLVLNGFPPLLATLIVSLAAILITIPLITGFSIKSLTAIIGASAGVAVALLLSLAFGWTMHLAGIITDELLTLFFVSNVNFNLRDIALSGMIFAALGAVMDISVSISSAVNEFFVVHPKVEFRPAFRSAFEVGHDNLGSMVNTLVMAYIGGALSLILIIYIKFDSQMPLAMIFSHSEILTEILKSFVGCMGMFIAVPVTAWVGVKLNLTRRSRSRN